MNVICGRNHRDNLEEMNKTIRKDLQYQDIKVVFVAIEAARLKEMIVSNAPSPIS